MHEIQLIKYYFKCTKQVSIDRAQCYFDKRL